MSTSGKHRLNLPTSIPPGEDALDRLAVAIDSYAKNAESMKRRSWWALSGVLLLAAAELTNAARQARHIVRAEAILPEPPAPR